MTTLAIIGAGIAGRSLLYSLAKEGKSFSAVHLFYSDSFTSPCSFNSTAIVAPRGLTLGLSDLGDKLIEGHETFAAHVAQDAPYGVTKIIQASGAYEKLEQFKQRYPDGKLTKKFGALSFLKETYLNSDPAFMIDPSIYLGWLLLEAERNLPLKIHKNFVTEIHSGEKIKIKTNENELIEVDQLVLAGGVYSKFWKNEFPDSKLHKTKSVQGSYLEFSGVDWHLPSFSLTLDGNNLIYNQDKGILLIGSTSMEVEHQLAPTGELKAIFESLSQHLELELPSYETGKIKVGLREKAPKREPYILQSQNMWAMGGFYKNGFSLALSQAQKLSLGIEVKT